jgi:hypothetical protein
MSPVLAFIVYQGRASLLRVFGGITAAAVAGFAAGYLPAGSLLAAAGLATICEVIGFYGCIGRRRWPRPAEPPPTWVGGAGWPPGRGMR